MKAARYERNKNSTKVILAVSLCLLILFFMLSLIRNLVFLPDSKPTLALSVVDSTGPDPATGLYRVMVEAEVEGKPQPQVDFNRNDGVGQVDANHTLILLEEGETYLLKAQAANPQGTAEAELEIFAGIILGSSSGQTGASGHSIPGNNGDTAPGEESSDGEFEDEERDPGQIGSIGEASALGPVESASPAEAPEADNGEASRDEPFSLPHPGDSEPSEEFSDSEEGVDSGPLGAPDSSEPTVPGDDGSSSFAPYAPGSGTLHTPLPSIITLQPIRQECGFITKDHSVYVNTYVYAGDDPYNRICRGFISFDISDLAGATVQRATLRLANPIIRGNPAIFHRTRQGLEIVDMEWHSNRLQKADYHRAGVRIATYQNYDITLDSFAGASLPMLADQLQRRIDSRSDRFRLRLQWVNETSNDNNAEDGVRYGSPLRDIVLTVYYTH